MSYDISFKVKVQDTDNVYIPVCYCEANITWNVRDIITKSTGLEWNNESNNGFCKDVIPKIEAGLKELEQNGDAYKKYESKNGWGTVDGTKRFFADIISAWKEFSECPFTPRQLVDVTTFWIE